MEEEEDFQEFVSIVERLVTGHLNVLKCNKRMVRVRLEEHLQQRLKKKMN